MANMRTAAGAFKINGGLLTDSYLKNLKPNNFQRNRFNFDLEIKITIAQLNILLLFNWLINKSSTSYITSRSYSIIALNYFTLSGITSQKTTVPTMHYGVLRRNTSQYTKFRRRTGDSSSYNLKTFGDHYFYSCVAHKKIDTLLLIAFAVSSKNVRKQLKLKTLYYWIDLSDISNSL